MILQNILLTVELLLDNYRKDYYYSFWKFISNDKLQADMNSSTSDLISSLIYTKNDPRSSIE